MNLENLDNRQKDVVSHIVTDGGTTLVLGGPGSGKTTTALFAARLYLEAGLAGAAGRVLFMTFSRAAVSQILGRAKGALGPCESRVEVATFHGLSFRLLRSFGRYAGMGGAEIAVETEARVRLLGRSAGKLSYSDLVPGALNLLRSESLVGLLHARWPLIICDEVQDTSPEQWQLLQRLSSGHVVLLGDPDQLIFTFVEGVSPERFRDIRNAANKEFLLDGPSHRDPTDVLPAVAAAIRARNFDAPVVTKAVADGRLRVVPHDGTDGDLQRVLADQLKGLRAGGARHIGVFAHTNAATADIGRLLHGAGIDHELAGIGEAHAEGMNAVGELLRLSVGLGSEEDVRIALACFLTASVRTRDVPALALGLVGRASFPETIQARLTAILEALRGEDWETVGAVVESLGATWETLRIVEGRRNWRRAVDQVRRICGARLGEEPTPDLVEAIVRESHILGHESLLSMARSETGDTVLMNFHQTKGKEADGVVHVFRDDDYFGRETEPYVANSRVLGVTISRARRVVLVLLPPNPHGLARPFLRYV